MGQVSFENRIILKGDANDAFNSAIEDANDENGHRQGYSGDIQCAHGFSILTDHPRYGTKAFDKWQEKHHEKMDKGDCICIEIKGAVLKRIKGNRWKGRRGVRGFFFFGEARD